MDSAAAKLPLLIAQITLLTITITFFLQEKCQDIVMNLVTGSKVPPLIGPGPNV